jgi:hypothetical protein
LAIDLPRDRHQSGDRAGRTRALVGRDARGFVLVDHPDDQLNAAAASPGIERRS